MCSFLVDNFAVVFYLSRTGPDLVHSIYIILSKYTFQTLCVLRPVNQSTYTNISFTHNNGISTSYQLNINNYYNGYIMSKMGTSFRPVQKGSVHHNTLVCFDLL